MATILTLDKFIELEGNQKTNPKQPQEMAISEINTNDNFNSDVIRITEQIKRGSKILQSSLKLNEEDSLRLAFYSFLLNIASKQNINFRITQFDSVLGGRKIEYYFKLETFFKKIDFLEKIYTKTIPVNYKKGRGQFFTPEYIAEFMAYYGFLSGAKHVLDPSAGGGIFLSKLNQTYMEPISCLAIDTDVLCEFMSLINFSRLKNHNIRFQSVDFLSFDSTEKFELIIANPPYIRFHDIENRDGIISKIEKEVDIPLSRLINYYALFFLHAYKFLEEGGRLVFITPSEFLNVNYGSAVKEFFKERFNIEALILFENGSLIFEDGLSTACITILRKSSKPDSNNEVKLIKLNEWIGKEKVTDLILNQKKDFSNKSFSLKIIKQRNLNIKEKWMKYFENNIKYESSKHNLIELSEIATVNRGIATGANEYFVLTKEDIDKWNIEAEFLKPVISKSNYCNFTNFTIEDFSNLLKERKPCYLLSIISKPTKNLLKYIEYGESIGFHKRYLTSHRTPWYSMEKRDPALIWAGVFSREDVKFIYNEANCYNLTTFHCIYPNFSDKNMILFLLAFLNSNHCRELMKREMRFYGGGLNKLEPKDLEKIPVINPHSIPKEKLKEIADLFSKILELERNGKAVLDIKTILEASFEGLLLSHN